METRETGSTGYRWAVVVDYDGPYGDRGEVKSRHRTYDAAVNRIRRLAPGESGNWLAIREIGE